MPEYAIYGKRTGLPGGKYNQPVYDKRFAALTYSGVRVSRLADAGTYATKEDAQEVLNKPETVKRIKDGLCVFEIRRVN